MYAQLRQSLPGVAAPTAAGAWLRWPRVSRNVVNLGLTSLFTDISSELVSTVLPLYLVFFLKFTPIQFGMLDGLYQGGASLIRVLGGAAADRSQKHREVAGLGLPTRRSLPGSPASLTWCSYTRRAATPTARWR